MRHLDLFSGIGGFALAARWMGWETVGFCEPDKFCQQVLKMHWPDVPIHDDVRGLEGHAVGSVDIITGGYPCQPFSYAGRRGGEEDDRHLWPEFARLISELGPRWVVGENVAGHVTMGLDAVLSDLEGLGYSWEAYIIPACAVDAPHRRDRVWIVGNANCNGQSVVAVNDETPGLSGDVGNTNNEGLEGFTWNGDRKRQPGRQQAQSAGSFAETPTEIRDGFWEPEPPICLLDDGLPDRLAGYFGRTATGIPHRKQKLMALGNAIVPQVAYEIFKAIEAADEA